MIRIDFSENFFDMSADIKRRFDRAQAGLAVEILLESRKQFEVTDSVASGGTRDKGRIVQTRAGYKVHFKSPADIVERGRRPNRKIPRWSIFKRILCKWANARGLTLTDQELYLVAQKIRRDGFKGRFPIARAVHFVKRSGRGDAAIQKEFL